MTFPSDLTRIAEVIADPYKAPEEKVRIVAEMLAPKPLRTRAEVAAEIVGIIRTVADSCEGRVQLNMGEASRLFTLCAEPVRDDDPPQPEEPLLDVLRQTLDMAPDASEATVLARICKLSQGQAQRERMTEAERHWWSSAKEAVQEAVDYLEATRWNPEGNIDAWSRTGDGENCAAVNRALKALHRLDCMPSLSAVRNERRNKPAADARPRCIRCTMLWTPPEGVDATVTPCFDCCYVEPAADGRAQPQTPDPAPPTELERLTPEDEEWCARIVEQYKGRNDIIAVKLVHELSRLRTALRKAGAQ